MTRPAWIREVREWVGTPFRWQGRIKQDGTDCWGLIVGAGHNCGYFPEGWDVRVYSRRTDLVAMGNEVLPRFFDKVAPSEIQAGDIVTWHRGAGIMHMGVLYDHCDSGLGLVHSEDWQRIVEHGLSAEHRQMITDAWRPRYTGT